MTGFMRQFADPATHATAVAIALLATAFVLCGTTWAAVSATAEPALQMRHLAFGALGALASTASGTLLLTIQVERATEADEARAFAPVAERWTPQPPPHREQDTA